MRRAAEVAQDRSRIVDQVIRQVTIAWTAKRPSIDSLSASTTRVLILG